MIGVSELLIILVVCAFLAAGIAAVIFIVAQLLKRNGQSALPPPAAETAPLAACPRCGTPLASDAAQGLCPRCVFQVGLGTQDGAETAFHDDQGRPNPPDPAELSRHFPQLEILELLGQGGMGAVYKARQKELDRVVALKVLPASTGRDPAFAERFTREARALARLNHPGIVGVHDFGQAGEFYYFVMEFIDGLNLRQMLRSRKLTPKEAMGIVPQICEALQFAHDGGVVHRDIKPENILVDKAGRVKIADFGIAKILGKGRDATLTGAKDVIGTPHYMAPEQVEKPTEVDHRADIYSLGVVFYEMLTGELPLGKFEVPSHKVQVDVRLDEVVLRALAKAPERRYQQANQVKTDVETIATHPGSPSPSSAAPFAPPQPPQPRARVASRGSVQPLLAAFLLIASLVAWVVIGYMVYIQPMQVERFSSLGMELPVFTRSLFQVGSFLRHFGFVLVPLLALVSMASFVWLILSSTRPDKWSAARMASDRAYVWSVRKAWGFGIASLCFAFATLIWSGQALRWMGGVSGPGYWGRPFAGGLSQSILPALMSLVAAIGFGVVSYRHARFARERALGSSESPNGAGAMVALTGFALVLQWTARVLGTLLLIGCCIFILRGGLPQLATRTGGFVLNFCALGAMLYGAVIGWKREGQAALFIAGGWALWQIFEGHWLGNEFLLPPVVAVLYGLVWWRYKRTEPEQPASTSAGLWPSQPPGVPSPDARFSRPAIVGAAWAASAFVVIVFKLLISGGGPGAVITPLGLVLGFVFVAIGLTAIAGTTVCGVIALSQIRRSEGKLCGLGLALFDALFFPFLILDALIVWLAYLVMCQALVWEGFKPGTEPPLEQALFPAFLIIVVTNVWLVRWAWAVVVRPPGASASESERGSWRAWNRVAIPVSVALVIGAIAWIDAYPGHIRRTVQQARHAGNRENRKLKDIAMAAKAQLDGYKLAVDEKVVFELVGILRDPRHSSDWIRPDGTPFETPPAEVLSLYPPQPISSPAPSFRAEDEVLVYWKHKDVRSSRMSWSEPVIHFHGRPTPMVRDLADGKERGTVAHFALRQPKDAMDLNVKLTLASAKWEPIATFDGEKTVSLLGEGSRNSMLMFSPLRYDQDAKRYVLDVMHNIPREEHALRLVARMRDGREEELVFHSGVLSGTPTKGYALIYPDEVNVNAVKEYVLERTPWVKGEMKGVALQTKPDNNPPTTAAPTMNPRANLLQSDAASDNAEVTPSVDHARLVKFGSLEQPDVDFGASDRHDGCATDWRPSRCRARSPHLRCLTIAG